MLPWKLLPRPDLWTRPARARCRPPGPPAPCRRAPCPTARAAASSRQSGPLLRSPQAAQGAAGRHAAARGPACARYDASRCALYRQQRMQRSVLTSSSPSLLPSTRCLAAVGQLRADAQNGERRQGDVQGDAHVRPQAAVPRVRALRCGCAPPAALRPALRPPRAPSCRRAASACLRRRPSRRCLSLLQRRRVRTPLRSALGLRTPLAPRSHRHHAVARAPHAVLPCSRGVAPLSHAWLSQRRGAAHEDTRLPLAPPSLRARPKDSDSPREATLI
jgi:hypothetical protein